MGNVCSCIGEIDNTKLKGKYRGEIIGMNKEGRGEFKFIDGNTYDGMWKDDKMNGYGIFTNRNGNRYEGDFKDNKREGHGIFYWKNGSKYDGNFKSNKKEGRAKFLNNRGDLYVGDFVNDKREGKFLLRLKNGLYYEQVYEKDCVKHSHLFESNWNQVELFKALSEIDSSLVDIFHFNNILDGMALLCITEDKLHEIGITDSNLARKKIMAIIDKANVREKSKVLFTRKCCPAGQSITSTIIS